MIEVSVSHVGLCWVSGNTLGSHYKTLQHVHVQMSLAISFTPYPLPPRQQSKKSYLLEPSSRARMNSSSEKASILAASMWIFCLLSTSISLACFLKALSSSCFCRSCTCRATGRLAKRGGGRVLELACSCLVHQDHG